MIGLNRLKRAISDVPTCGMQTGSPKVKLDLSDAHRVVAEMEQLEREKDELVAQVEYVKSHFNELIAVAQRCDSWESFPQEPLDRSVAALESLPEQFLNQIKAEAGRAGYQACLDAIVQSAANAIANGETKSIIPTAEEYFA